MSELLKVFEGGIAQINAGRIDELLEGFHRDGRMVMPGGEELSWENLGDLYRMMTVAYPDMRWEILRSIEAGQTLIVELRFHGTQTGPLYLPTGPLPPTGRRVTYRTCEVIDYRDGKVALWHAYFDQVAIITQLGLMT